MILTTEEMCQKYERDVRLQEMLVAARLACLTCPYLRFTSDEDGDSEGLYCAAKEAFTGPDDDDWQTSADLAGARQLYTLEVEHLNDECPDMYNPASAAELVEFYRS
jgi:hypothetical protein